MTNNKQSGFGVAIIIIVAVVVLAILGYAGYRVYTANNKPASTSHTTASSQTASSTRGSNNQNQNTQSTATYLDIKELGIKIKLSDSIKDAVYSYSGPTSQTYATFGGSVYFSTQTLANEDTACGPSNGPLGAIVKITGDTDGSGNLLQADNNTVFKLGGDYYRYETPQAPCSNSSSVNLLASSQKTAFAQTFKTIQLDK